ncbi:MAG: fatty acid desaturase [Acidimicrobiales bacterium]|nr:fatty acid desaturase [Acidimicrobiales bacterium]
MNSILLGLLIGFLIFQLAIFSTTLYLHRQLTHKAVSFRPIVNEVFRFVIWTTSGIRPRQWVAVHRKHHAHTDTMEDPHSPKVLGWKRVQLMNVFLYRKVAKDGETVSNYARDLPQRISDRLFYDHAILGLGFLFAGLAIWFGIITAIVAFTFHSLLYLGLSGSVNSVAHHFGRQSFKTNSGTNVIWLAILTAGEGLHNHHHAAPTSARFSRRWYQIDPGWWAIKVMAFLKLANVRHSDVDKLASRTSQIRNLLRN